MDGWPSSWRSLAWFSLAREAVGAGALWVWRQVHQFDPTRRYEK